MREYDSLIRSGLVDFRRRCDRGIVDRRAEALVTLSLLRRTGSKLKAESAIEIASDLLNQDLSVVIFCDFIESIDVIADRLSQFFPTDRIKGETSKRDRAIIETRFQSCESRALVASLKSCGAGITLTAAHHLILVDRPYSPEDINQAADRIHRIGQTKSCTNYWLQLGKVDQKIDQANERKSSRIAKVLS
jgi:SNF2 family DNA or RNA helicase